MTFNKKIYDALKFIAMVLLPAAGTLYFALAGIWNLPSAEQVVGTITVVDTFLGTILHLASNTYSKSDAKFDGVVNTLETQDKTTFSLALNDHPDTIKEKSELVLKVNPVQPPPVAPTPFRSS